MGESSIASFTVRWDDESMWGRSTVREGKRLFTIVAGVSQCCVRCLRQGWYILVEPQEMIASSLYMPCYIQRTIWVRLLDSKKKVKRLEEEENIFLPSACWRASPSALAAPACRSALPSTASGASRQNSYFIIKFTTNWTGERTTRWNINNLSHSVFQTSREPEILFFMFLRSPYFSNVVTYFTVCDLAWNYESSWCVGMFSCSVTLPSLLLDAKKTFLAQFIFHFEPSWQLENQDERKTNDDLINFWLND